MKDSQEPWGDGEEKVGWFGSCAFYVFVFSCPRLAHVFPFPFRGQRPVLEFEAISVTPLAQQHRSVLSFNASLSISFVSVHQSQGGGGGGAGTVEQGGPAKRVAPAAAGEEQDGLFDLCALRARVSFFIASRARTR